MTWLTDLVIIETLYCTIRLVTWSVQVDPNISRQTLISLLYNAYYARSKFFKYVFGRKV